jgi:rod shape-determining protein MreD
MHAKRFGLITITFVVALLLSIVKLPEWAAWFRPAWVPVLLLFWVLVLPQRVGLGIAWGLGIVLDVLNATLLGEHALGLVLIAYLCLRFYRQVRMFPMMQQAVVITVLISIYQGLLFWIQHMRGQAMDSSLFWFPVLATLVIWPGLCLLFQDGRR